MLLDPRCELRSSAEWPADRSARIPRQATDVMDLALQNDATAAAAAAAGAAEAARRNNTNFTRGLSRNPAIQERTEKRKQTMQMMSTRRFIDELIASRGNALKPSGCRTGRVCSCFNISISARAGQSVGS